MKRLDISALTDSAQMPIKRGTLAFLQDAHKETLAATIIALIGPGYNPLTVYVLYGCVDTGVGSTFTISAGALFINGEVFMVDAVSFTVTGANVPVFNYITTQYTTDADPVTFTDTTVHNIHNIKKVQIAAGASGSGIGDYTARFVLSFVIPQQVNLSGAGVTGSYPNFVIPGGSGAFPIVAAGNQNVGDLGSSATTVTIALGTTLASNNYMPLVTIISNDNNVPSGNDSTVFFAIGNKTATSFDIYFRESNAVTQNISVDWAIVRRW